MVKRYSNVAGRSHLSETMDPVTHEPRGDYIASADYDALLAALHEALQEWYSWSKDEITDKRIAALRAQFLDDK